MKQYLIKFLYKSFNTDTLTYVDKEQILLVRAKSYDAARTLLLDSKTYRCAHSFENLTIE